MAPDVAQTGRTQQRIGDGMQQGIRIGVAEQPFFIRDIHATDDELAARDQLMDVETLTYAHFLFSLSKQ